jgi:hypothetical protein
MGVDERQRRLQQIPERIKTLVAWLDELNLPIADWFEGVGSNYQQLSESLQVRRDEMLVALAA